MKLRRTTCTGLFTLGAFGVMMLDPQFTSGQPGGGGREFKFGGGQPGGGGREFKFGGGGGPPGGGGMQPGGGFGGGKNPFTDPDTVFNFYSKGSDVIDFSRMDPNMKAFAKRGFEKAGLPAPTDTTVITKAQFTESFTRALAAKGITPGGSPTPQPSAPPGGGSMSVRVEGGGNGNFRMEGGGDRNRSFGPSGGSPPGGGYGNRDGGGSGGLEREKSGGPSTFRMTDQDIERRFADQDVNRDGKLSEDEISDRSPLKASFKESDTSRDGYIDMAEYKAYIAVRFGGEGSDPNAGSYGSYAGNGNYGRENRDPRGDRKEEQPVVAIRYGKLPSGLPSWWDTLDGDKDGQIGLYEWRQDGRDMKEFQKMDLDGDGVLAPQEWARFNIQSAEKAKAIAAEDEIGSSGAKSGRPSYGSGSSTPSYGSGGNKNFGPGGGKDKGSEKGSERTSDKDAKNPFRQGGKK